MEKTTDITAMTREERLAKIKQLVNVLRAFRVDYTVDIAEMVKNSPNLEPYETMDIDRNRIYQIIHNQYRRENVVIETIRCMEILIEYYHQERKSFYSLVKGRTVKDLAKAS